MAFPGRMLRPVLVAVDQSSDTAVFAPGIAVAFGGACPRDQTFGLAPTPHEPRRSRRQKVRSLSPILSCSALRSFEARYVDFDARPDCDKGGCHTRFSAHRREHEATGEEVRFNNVAI